MKLALFKNPVFCQKCCQLSFAKGIAAIILFAIILFLQSHQLPPQVDFKITELGIIVGGRFYTYSEFNNFYITTLFLLFMKKMILFYGCLLKIFIEAKKL